MALKREEQKRAKGEGWYSSYGSDASDVLDYISNDLERLSDEPSPSRYEGTQFKVTIIVEEI